MRIKLYILSLFFVIVLISARFNNYNEPEISDETQQCLSCHSTIHPGIVSSWKKSLHSKITPIKAKEKPELELRVSFKDLEDKFANVVVGCYECHSINTDQHKDAFEHNGFTINVIVTPKDCSKCHPVEAEQYSKNLMAFAHTNLVENPVYQQLMQAVNNPHRFHNDKLIIGKENELTNDESCFYCHGTQIVVKGFEKRETDFGELEFPILQGWPNQGVGRINPDGSRGSCSACHTRHTFSIEVARKPYTCAECHKGPDVPAFKVYEVSKHGNIYSSNNQKYNFLKIPWRVGEDFEVPTCATCHISLIVSPDGEVISERTHQMNDRLAWRLFGVPYSHPHPVNADLSKAKNKQNLPLLVELTGEPVKELVITKDEQQKRNERMKKICNQCHSTSWVNSHFVRLENTIAETNNMTLEATKILSEFWKKGYAKGLPQNENIFDEEIERLWTSVWLYYANSTRFASAMAGGGDYGVFADGRYQMTEQLYKMKNKLELHKNKKR